MSYGKSDMMDVILAQEGDTRCAENCPHLDVHAIGKGIRKPPRIAAKCTFYRKPLKPHGLLPGFMACEKCLNDSATEEMGWQG